MVVETRPAPGRWRSRAAILGAVAAVGVLTSGCSTFAILNAAENKGGVAETRDVAYAPGPRRGLDIYAPRQRLAGRPVVVFFYGGSWNSGKRQEYRWVGYALARRGYVAIVPDYRIYPQVVWPAFLEDSALAVRWSRDHAAAFGGDPSRLILMGHSAGAYNVVDLAVDKRWLGAVGMDPSRDLRAVVGLSGPYDFLPLREAQLKTIFGPPAQRPDTQPINHVDGPAPPMLLITGDRDTTVDPGNTDRMAAKLKAAGDQARTIHFAKLDHVRTVAALAGPLRWLGPVLKDVTAFIDQETGFTDPDRAGA